jgi:hypothetical protein
MISLTTAKREHPLPEFIAQEEARGIRPADLRRLENAIREAVTVKDEQSADQTSRSPSGDGLT